MFEKENKYFDIFSIRNEYKLQKLIIKEKIEFLPIYLNGCFAFDEINGGTRISGNIIL